MARTMLCFAVCVSFCGCMESLEEQTKKSPNSIIGKTTQDVGKFDPNAGDTVSDSKIHATTPGLTGLQAYGPMMEQISKLGVDSQMNYFYAENGRFPKDYDEFMEKIIKEGGIKLPVLPGGSKYQYDEEAHKLVIINAPAEAK